MTGLHWAVEWRSANRLDGVTKTWVWRLGQPAIFRTRGEAREWIEKRYGYIRHRHIGFGRESLRPHWTHWWAGEDARQHMVGVTRGLGWDESKNTAPRWKPEPGTTPRLGATTFAALKRGGLIEAVKRRVPRAGWTDMYYYQISPAGRRAIMREGRSALARKLEDK